MIPQCETPFCGLRAPCPLVLLCYRCLFVGVLVFVPRYDLFCRKQFSPMWFPFSLITLRPFPATFSASPPLGQPRPVMPALHPRLYFFLGHSVPFLVITTVIALRLNPSLINDSFKSVNNSCCCLQNCLRAFGVFVLMECEKCARDSRCGITHHIHCRRAQAQAPTPRSGSSQTGPHKLLWSFWSVLSSSSSLIIPGFFGHYITFFFFFCPCSPLDYLGS